LTTTTVWDSKSGNIKVEAKRPNGYVSRALASMFYIIRMNLFVWLCIMTYII